MKAPKFPPDIDNLKAVKQPTRRQWALREGVEGLLDKLHRGNVAVEQQLETVRSWQWRMKFKLIVNIQAHAANGAPQLYRDPNQPVTQLR